MDVRQNSNPQGELIRLQKEVEKLREEKIWQKDQISALKSESRAYEDELGVLNHKVQRLEQQALQKSHTGEIGEQVRLRYLERHRQRMRRGIGKIGFERIRSGDCAAHRGRPVVDALLCQTGVMTDPEVYKNLYGMTSAQMIHLKDVPEIVEISSFHASLQSEGHITKDFKAVFDRICDVANSYASPIELRVLK